MASGGVVSSYMAFQQVGQIGLVGWAARLIAESAMSDSFHEDASGKQARVTLARHYPEYIRKEAVVAVEERRLHNPRDRTIYREIAEQFNVGEQSLRLWVKKYDAERAARKAGETGVAEENLLPDGAVMTAEKMQAELDSMRKKIEQLQAENDVLKRAFVVFSAEWSK